MDRARGTVERLLRPHAKRAAVGAVADLEVHLAGLHEKGLVLAHVVLPRQALPRVDVQDLSDVARSLGPDELVAPGLVHAAHRSFLCRDRPAVKVATAADRAR